MTLTTIIVAFLGWGAFASASHSSDVAWRGLHEAIAVHNADRAKLLQAHAAALQEAQDRITQLEQQLRLATMNAEDASSEVTQTGGLHAPEAVSTNRKSDRIKPRR